jgi:DNA-binding beta-propeller fold protein YncE
MPAPPMAGVSAGVRASGPVPGHSCARCRPRYLTAATGRSIRSSRGRKPCSYPGRRSSVCLLEASQRCSGSVSLWGGTQGQAQATKPAAKSQVPSFKLDTSWPKALPNNWVFGGASSVAADKHGHIWVLSRPLSVPAAELAAGKIPSPPVIELDQEGNFVRGWGGPQWVQPWFKTPDPLPDYPEGVPPEHGIYVDNDDNVWLTGGGHIVLKFSRSGELLLQIGEFGKSAGSNDDGLLGNPNDVAVDTKRNEVYVADGYLNRRAIVFDSETGEYKRHWGAYGNVPDDGPPELYQPGQPLPRQFFVAHCIDVSNDGLVYVCDRQRNRVQVFTKDGEFVKEVVHTPDAPAGAGITVKGPFGDPAVSGAGFGSGNSLAFSADRRQEFLYISAPPGIKIFRRRTLEFLGSFAAGGTHGITTDSDGSIITAGREKYDLTGYVKAPKKAGASSR